MVSALNETRNSNLGAVACIFMLIYISNYMFLCNDDPEARLDLPAIQSNTVEHDILELGTNGMSGRASPGPLLDD